MFDFQATLKWVSGIVSDPVATANEYAATQAPWMQSLMQIVLPVYGLAFVAMILFGLLLGFGVGSPVASFGGFLLFAVLTVAGTLLIALIFDKLAGMFDGEPNFNAAYGCVALASVPAAAANIAGFIPWLGWLIGLALNIYALVLSYKFIPIFLKVHEDSRIKHFVVSIIIAIAAYFVISLLVVGMFFGSMADLSDRSDNNRNSTHEAPMSEVMDRLSDQQSATDARDDIQRAADAAESVGGGLLGGFERQAGFVEAAEADQYSPPSSGELEEDQVEFYVVVLEKTQKLRQRLEKGLEKMDSKDQSLTSVFGGIGDAVRMSTADMEVVKSAGGNWAEYRWVRDQIETARIQEDLNDTTSHNFALFQKYQARIEAVE